MPRVVDWELLRQVTTDTIRVYEAITRAQTMTAESERVLAMAEDLLRQAGLAYLLEGTVAEPESRNESRSAPEEMVSAYVRIQQAYADLKDTLYHLAKALLETKSWENARAVLNALNQIETNYQDIADLLKNSYMIAARDYFFAQEWRKQRDELEALLSIDPNDRWTRKEFLTSFVYEAQSKALDPGVGKEHLPSATIPLLALASCEPRVRQFTLYQQAIDALNSLAQCRARRKGLDKVISDLQGDPNRQELLYRYGEQRSELDRQEIELIDAVPEICEQLSVEIANLLEG